MGESLYSALHFRDYLQRRACSIVQVDVARIGGITPWLKVAHLAETFNVVGLPAFPDGTACRALRRRSQCALGRIHPATGQPDHEGHVHRRGYAVPSSEPGLGIAWDFDAIDRQTVEGSRFLLSN